MAYLSRLCMAVFIFGGLFNFLFAKGTTPDQTVTTDAPKTDPRVYVIPSVLTTSQAQANYGKDIATRFYVVPLTIVNDTTNNVFVQAVSFMPPSLNKKRIAAVSLVTVLQEVQRQKSLDFRTRTSQILMYGSLILPGPTPFFKNVLARATYNQVLSIYNLARTSAFDTFPDYLDDVIKLLQSNKLFTQNYQLGPHLSATIDTFVSAETLATGLRPLEKLSGDGLKQARKTNKQLLKDARHLTQIEVLQRLGDPFVYYLAVPPTAVNRTASQPKVPDGTSR